GLRMILSQEADLEIVAEASDGIAAIEAVRRFKPEVILMDLRMPRMGGAEATRRIRAEFPETKIVVLTTFEEEQDVFDALCAGASGYLLKDAGSDRLCEAIRLAARGEIWLQPSVAAKLVAEFGHLMARAPARSAARLIEPISARESDVLRCLSEGLSNKEIGRRLEISEGTVKNHMSQILGKLQVLDRTQAALRARDLGLL
ncbi:MAG: response regulator, partial [Opitutaceae bacterium]